MLASNVSGICSAVAKPGANGIKPKSEWAEKPTNVGAEPKSSALRAELEGCAKKKMFTDYNQVNCFNYVTYLNIIFGPLGIFSFSTHPVVQIIRDLLKCACREQKKQNIRSKTITRNVS